MKSFLSRKLVIGAVGLAVLAGAGGAVAATQNSTSPAAQEQAYLNDLASKLGVTPSALSAAIKAANSDQIDAALAAGRLTAAEASALKARIAVSTTAPFFGYGFGRHGSGGRGFGGRGFGGGIDAAAATSLGISEATLRSDLQAGQSLDAIAAALGKNAADLKAAIIAAETSALNTAVSNGQITSTEETQRLSDLSSRIDALLARTWTAGTGAWAGHDRGGSGIFGGSQPQPTAY